MFAVTRFRYIEALFLIQQNLDETNLYITQSTVQRTIISFAPVIVKYEEKNFDITKPRYREHILLIPWSFVISGFFSSYFTITVVEKKIVRCTKDCIQQRFVKSSVHCTLNQRILFFLLQSLCTPLGFVFWTLFQEKPFHWNPTLHTSTWLSITALLIMVPAAFIYNTG